VTDLRVDLDWQKLRRALAEAPEEVHTEFRRAFSLHGAEIVGEIQKDRIRGGSGDPKPDWLTSRSGFFRRSWGFDVSGRGIEQVLVIYSTDPKAAIHEYGGEIVPRRASWLAIPMDAAKTRSGIARGGPRTFERTFFLESNPSTLLMFQKPESGSGEPDLLFVLKKSVQIPARLGFGDLFRRRLDKLSARLDDALGRILKGRRR
jgi:hypothetical protein